MSKDMDMDIVCINFCPCLHSLSRISIRIIIVYWFSVTSSFHFSHARSCALYDVRNSGASRTDFLEFHRRKWLEASNFHNQIEQHLNACRDEYGFSFTIISEIPWWQRNALNTIHCRLIYLIWLKYCSVNCLHARMCTMLNGRILNKHFPCNCILCIFVYRYLLIQKARQLNIAEQFVCMIYINCLR